MKKLKFLKVGISLALSAVLLSSCAIGQGGRTETEYNGDSGKRTESYSPIYPEESQQGTVTEATPVSGSGTMSDSSSQSFSEPPSPPEDQAATEALTPPAMPPTKPISPAETLLSLMSLEEKVSQLFTVTPEALLGADAPVTEYAGEPFAFPVGGVVLFSENILDRSQCISLLSGLQEASSIPLFTAVDEEGGQVARISGNPSMGTSPIPPMADIKTVEQAYGIGKSIGSQIRQLGFNLDFAPVADVASDPLGSVMGDRSFGSDTVQVSCLVAEAVRGFKESGVLCTLKHFPGHGNTDADSHRGTALLDRTQNELRETELPPFRAGIEAGAELVMVGHISAPAVTGNDLPATLSPSVISILRRELGFEGIIITDSMQMKAITSRYSSGEAAVMALEAGVDMILMPQSLEAAHSAVTEAVKQGRLTEERIDQSVLSVLELKFAKGIVSEHGLGADRYLP